MTTLIQNQPATPTYSVAHNLYPNDTDTDQTTWDELVESIVDSAIAFKRDHRSMIAAIRYYAAIFITLIWKADATQNIDLELLVTACVDNLGVRNT